MKLKSIGLNLLEMKAAAASVRQDIVADPWCERIYCSKSGLGRLYKFIYKLLPLLGFENFEANCLQKTMQLTHRTYRSHLERNAQAAIDYKNKLTESFTKPTGTVKKMAASRRQLVAWNQLSVPLRKEVNSINLTVMKNYLHIGFCAQRSKIYEDPFNEGKLKSVFNELQSVLKLESATRGLIPTKIFSKAARNQKLTKDESVEMKKFVACINANQKAIGIRAFHRAIKCLLELEPKEMKLMKGTKDLAELELAFVKLDCPILLEPDKKLLSKRPKTGDKIEYNCQILTLKERLGTKALEDDQNATYLTNYRNVVVSFPLNEALIRLKQSVTRTENWGIKSCRVHAVEEKGQYVLLERLYDHLGSYQWVSKSPEIDKVDLMYADPICTMIRWFTVQNRTPVNLKSEYLMFDTQGYLKNVKLTPKGEFDFDALVAFVHAACDKNSFVLRYVLRHSELKDHPFAEFYRVIIQYASQNKSHSPKHVAASMKIVDSRLVARAKQLLRELEEMKDTCELRIRTYLGYDITDEASKRMATNFNAQLFKLYTENEVVGVLPESFKKELIDIVVKQFLGENYEE